MISKNQIKHISSLKLSKFRKEFNEFVVEGEKIVEELLKSNFQITALFGLEDWLSNFKSELEDEKVDFHQCSPKELGRISTLKTPNKVLSVVKIPGHPLPEKNDFNDLILVLDKIQDPGNLGTIIRTADWFGVKHIVCSEDTVDVYNPKVIQSTMGSFLRVQTHYTNLEGFFKKDVPKDLNIYGALLNGKNIYKHKFPGKGILIIGNESKGISESISRFVTHRISIPSYQNKSAESLNASVAAAILMSEFRR
jgi:RNA methyltransferase, TrmH family